MILKSLLKRVRGDVTCANDLSERKLVRIASRTKVKTKTFRPRKKNTSTAKLFLSAYSYKKSYQYPRSSAVDNESNNLASGWTSKLNETK